MRLILICTFLIMCQTISTAQSKRIKAKLKQANKEFKKENYDAAIPLYLEVLDKKDIDEAQVNLAEIYRRIGNWEEAEYWYGQIVFLPEIENIWLLNYGKVLQANGKYDRAREFFVEYSRLEPDDLRGILLAKACEKPYGCHFPKWHQAIEIIPVLTNISSDESFPTLYEQGLLFASNKDFHRGCLAHRNPEIQMYYTKIDTLDEVNMEFIYDTLVTKFWESPYPYFDYGFSFNSKKDILFFTRGIDNASNYWHRNYDFSIYRTVKIDDKWQEPDRLSFYSEDYDMKHPFWDDQQQRLYFSSNISGGFGDFDIYYSDYVYGAWTNPTNLGSNVNSEGYEAYPFFHKESQTLYFSSDGRIRNRNLDIYASKLEDDEYQQANALPKPINSQYSETSFLLFPDQLFGYVVSDRIDNNDDIYSFRKKVVFVELTVIDDQNSAVLPNVKILLNGLESIFLTSKNGKVRFELPLDECIEVKFEFENYQATIIEICTKGLENVEQLNKQITLKPK